MEEKYVLSSEDLERHFEEQLSFLKASADSFDLGFEAEAKRIAVVLRVLLHDTPKSISLLSQLGKKDIAFLDSSDENSRRSVGAYSGLLVVALGPPRTRFIAPLDECLWEVRRVPFDEWWTQTIFKDESGRSISRRALVLTAANQDGGTHVDPGLDLTYADLVKNNSLRLTATDRMGSRPIAGAERVAIRQIAHEVLKSLVPGYTKKVDQPASLYVGSITVVEEEADMPPRAALPVTVSDKVGRNQKCPCGSGKKYKHCHGKNA